MESHRGKILSILITFLVSMTFVQELHAARAYDIHDYNRWALIPSDSLMRMGRRYLNEENHVDSAMICFSILANKQFSQDLSHNEAELVCRAINNIGYIYFYKFNDYKLSLEHLSRAGKMAEKYGFTHLIPHISLNTSNIYLAEVYTRRQYGDMKQVLKMFKTTYAEALKSDDKELLIGVMNDMLNIAFTTGNMDEIRQEISSFEVISFPENMPMLGLTLQQLRGIKFFEKGDHEGAIREFSLMEKLVYPVSTPERQLVIAYEDMMHVYKVGQRYAEAESLLRKILDIACHHNALDVESNTYASLSHIRALQGDSVGYKTYLLKFYELRDSMLYGNNLGKLDEVKFLGELQKVQEEVHTLSHKHRVQKAVIIGVTVIVAILITFLVIIILAYRKLQMKNKRLYSSSVKVLDIEDIRKKKHLEAKKYSYNPITDDRKEDIMERIEAVMDTTDEIYAEDFSLQRLAELVNIKYRQVSQVINEKTGKNFHQLLNEYRINEACRRLRDKAQYGNYTVEAIASSVGIKSRSNFSVTFKKITGLSPSEYQKLAKKD